MEMDSEKRIELELYGKSILGELLEPGERFGRFEIVETLTVTLFGALYRAKNRRNAEINLIHVFPTGLVRDPRFRERLDPLIEKLSKLRQDSTLIPIEVVESENIQAVVYENFEGETLTRAFLKKSPGKGMHADQVKKILIHTATSVRSASELGINHFALTTDFILCNDRGDIKIYGYGTWNAIDRRRFEIFVSSAIVPIKREEESPGYTLIDVMSPEVRNDEAHDERSDVYALGILSYYLLTHRRPVIDWVLPTQARPELSEGWDFFVSRCLEGDTELRYPTCGAFLADLEKVDNLGKEVQARSGLMRKLDRIPLTEGIKRRYSEQTQTLIRLGILGVFGIAVIGTAILLYWMLFGDSADTEGLRVVKVNEGETPNLILKIEPPRARVRFLGPNGSSFIVNDGTLEIRAPFSKHSVKIDAPQYQSRSFTIELGKDTITKKVDLPLSLGKLKIKSLPRARMYVVNAEGKKTFLDIVPDSGEWSSENRLFVQSYNILVSRPGYEERIFNEVKLSSEEWTELEATLEALPSSIKVVTEPPGASVEIAGKTVGKTPFQMSGIEPGKVLKISVSGNGLRRREQSVTTEPGKEALIDFGNLEAMAGNLELSVEAQGAPLSDEQVRSLQIRIQDQVYTAVSKLNCGLKAGTHSVAVEHPQYFPWEGSVTIRDAESTVSEVKLQPRPGRLFLNIPSSLGTPRILIAGKATPPNEQGIEITPNATVEVIIVVRDAIPERREFHFEPNEHIEWNPEFQRIPGAKLGTEWKVPYLGLQMPWIPMGAFTMGSPVKEQLRRPNEGPSTHMTVTRGFWISATEVTQEAYERVMNDNPSHFRGEKRPVEQVSWDNAVTFTERLTQVEARGNRLPPGYVYRLPTEAEWEYVCRAGSSAPFGFGSSASPEKGNFLGEYPRDYASSEIVSPDHFGTVNVGSYPANSWGVHDMHGNVQEWTLDSYNDRLPGGVEEDFVRTDPGRGHAIRGGGWDSSADRCRASARDLATDSSKRNNLGFRIVLAPEINEK